MGDWGKEREELKNIWRNNGGKLSRFNVKQSIDSSSTNPKLENTKRTDMIVIKLLKAKAKEKILKAGGKNKTY